MKITFNFSPWWTVVITSYCMFVGVCRNGDMYSPAKYSFFAGCLRYTHSFPHLRLVLSCYIPLSFPLYPMIAGSIRLYIYIYMFISKTIFIYFSIYLYIYIYIPLYPAISRYSSWFARFPVHHRLHGNAGNRSCPRHVCTMVTSCTIRLLAPCRLASPWSCVLDGVSWGFPARHGGKTP